MVQSGVCAVQLAIRHRQAGADLRTIQRLLGRVKLEHTVLYLHLSRRHLHAVANPLDTMPVSRPDTARPSRRLHKR